MKNLMNKFKQPLSLRWKWGLFLLLVFVPISLLSLWFQHHQYNSNLQKNFMINYQNHYEHLNSILSKFEKPFYRMYPQAFDSPIIRDDQQKQAIDVIHTFEDPDTIIRLFDINNQIIYETKRISLPSINHSERLKQVLANNTEYYIGFRPIISERTDQKIGSFQIIVQPKFLISFHKYSGKLLINILLGVLAIVLVAIFDISRRFLKPLTYLNNSLDLVEEENLSYIRVRRPQADDEWSDLSLHVNRLLDKIDKYVSSQKQFVEDVSHELRTPVAIVEGHLKLLNRWGKDDPEILDESIQLSLQEISRMKDLVQEMLDLSRADNVDVDYRNEITEVYSTVKQVFNNFALIHEDFNFYLDCDDKGEELYIQAFRNHFEQILIILLDNAVKYSTDLLEIHVSVSQTVNKVEISVQDFGEGMSEEDKERVFGRFYRVDKARTREKGGNGLGLSIAQQLVHGYKGNIWVESVLNSGSIFYISFPIITSQRQIFKSKKIAQRRKL